MQSPAKARPVDAELGTALSPAEIDFATRRLPVCNCPAYLLEPGRWVTSHTITCTAQAGFFLPESQAA